MKALAPGKQEAEYCENCAGTGWLLNEASVFHHVNRARLADDVIARAIACTYRDHDEECLVVPSKETQTEASPCLECKPNWVHPNDRKKSEPLETNDKRREREHRASSADQSRWWD